MADAAPILPLAWERPYVAGVALKKEKRKKKITPRGHLPLFRLVGSVQMSLRSPLHGCRPLSASTCLNFPGSCLPGLTLVAVGGGLFVGGLSVGRVENDGRHWCFSSFPKKLVSVGFSYAYSPRPRDPCGIQGAANHVISSKGFWGERNQKTKTKRKGVDASPIC